MALAGMVLFRTASCQRKRGLNSLTNLGPDQDYDLRRERSSRERERDYLLSLGCGLLGAPKSESRSVPAFALDAPFFEGLGFRGAGAALPDFVMGGASRSRTSGAGVCGLPVKMGAGKLRPSSVETDLARCLVGRFCSSVGVERGEALGVGAALGMPLGAGTA